MTSTVLTPYGPRMQEVVKFEMMPEKVEHFQLSMLPNDAVTAAFHSAIGLEGSYVTQSKSWNFHRKDHSAVVNILGGLQSTQLLILPLALVWPHVSDPSGD